MIGPGSFSWASDTFSVNAKNFEFGVDITTTSVALAAVIRW